MDNKPAPKDIWDKLRVLGSLLPPIVIFILGILFNMFLQEKDKREARTELYVQLLSQREESESALRKDMFSSIIDTYLNPSEQNPLSLGEKLLNLELLAYNFHDSINLKPLFNHLLREIPKDVTLSQETRDYYASHLIEISKEISQKQLTVLSEFQLVKNIYRSFSDLNTMKKDPNYFSETVSFVIDNVSWNFRIFIEDYNIDSREIKLRITARNEKNEESLLEAKLWSGFFDFPMIDNIRLPEGIRCAVVINNFSADAVHFTFVCFPASYSSLKEKPYLHEVLNDLLKN